MLDTYRAVKSIQLGSCKKFFDRPAASVGEKIRDYKENLNSPLITSYERDNETDLDFAQARMHDYNHGRFTSPDDFLNDTYVGDASSWNLYVYVRNNPLNYVDPFGEEVNGNDLTDKQRGKIIDDYKKKTGFKSVRFDESGMLVVDDRDNFEGGSASAREDLLAAIDTKQSIFKLRGVSEDERDAVDFASFTSPSVVTRDDGSFAAEYGVAIDFDDFANAEGSREILEANSIGLVLNHEFTHNSKKIDPTGERERGQTDSNIGGLQTPGPVEDRINQSRRELGLPERAVYFYTKKTVTFLTPQGDKKVEYKTIPFKYPNGKTKLLRWKAKHN